MPAKYAGEFSSIRTIPSAPEFHRFSLRPAATGRKRKVAGYTADRELEWRLCADSAPNPENLVVRIRFFLALVNARANEWHYFTWLDLPLTNQYKW